MATQTGSIDLKAAKNAHDEASKKATNYLSADDSGIMVYDGSNGAQTPSNPNADTRNVFIDSDSVDVRLGSDVLAAFGEETVIGKDGRSRLVFDSTEMYGITNQDIESFRISGDGASETNMHTTAATHNLRDTGYHIIQIPFNSGETAYVDYYRFSVNTGEYKILKKLTLRYGTSISETYVTADSCRYYYKYDGVQTFSYKKAPLEGTAGDRIRLEYRYPVHTPSPYYTFGTRKPDTTLGAYSFSAGINNTASALKAHAEGSNVTASGEASHAEGANTTASGSNAHAEGYQTTASFPHAHAEGSQTTASSYEAHAEGYQTTASANSAHAEGFVCVASGNYSHAGGKYTKASGEAQTAIGKANIEDTDTYAFIIGNGTSDTARSNAFTVDWSGNVDIPSGASYKVNGASLIDIFYPVGSYYETSDTSFDPNTAWGGTWVQEVAGQVHVSSGTGYSVSGALTNASDGGNPDAIVVHHTHTIKRTTDVGVAAHGITQPAFTIPNHTHTWKGWNGLKSASSGTTKEVRSRSAISTDPADTATTSSGGGGACTRTTNVALTNNHSITQPVFAAEATGTSGAEVGANMQPYIVVNRWHRTA